MTRFAVVIAAGWIACSGVACFHAHPEGQQELRGEDCFGCHATDYAATAAPVHRDNPEVYSTTCDNCHRMTGWRPALDGKHSDVFVIAQGDHANIACKDCHDLTSELSSVRGANTTCLGCHPDSPVLAAQHVGADLDEDEPYVYKPSVANFCLECHPAGAAEEHPEDDFARTGDHAVTCSMCHDRAAGPDKSNVTCVESRCHHTVRETDDTDGHKDGDYQKARGKGTDRDFCHACH